MARTRARARAKAKVTEPSKGSGTTSTAAIAILFLGVILASQIRLQGRTGSSFVSYLLQDYSQQPLERIANNTQGDPASVDTHGKRQDLPSTKETTLNVGSIASPQGKSQSDGMEGFDASREVNAKRNEAASSTDGATKKDMDDGPKKTKKPLNVIVLYPDDWRHDDIGGVSPVLRTPFLNQLAQQGIRFTYNAVTTSICWISRATLFTGQYASRHKSLRIRQPVFYNDWDKNSFPALLQKHAGYFVGHVGKWQYQNKEGIVGKLFNWTSLFEGYHWYKGIPAANYTRDETIRFLRERPKDQPFAVTVAFYPPKGKLMVRESGNCTKVQSLF